MGEEELDLMHRLMTMQEQVLQLQSTTQRTLVQRQLALRHSLLAKSTIGLKRNKVCNHSLLLHPLLLHPPPLLSPPFSSPPPPSSLLLSPLTTTLSQSTPKGCCRRYGAAEVIEADQFHWRLADAEAEREWGEVDWAAGEEERTGEAEKQEKLAAED
jgi:hypothetical protein